MSIQDYLENQKILWENNDAPTQEIQDVGQLTAAGAALEAAAPVLSRGVSKMVLSNMHYEGTVGHVAAELSYELCQESGADWPSLTLSASRLVRATLNAKINYGDIDFEDVRRVSDFALDVFQGEATPESLRILLAQTEELPLAQEIHQIPDGTTFTATRADKMFAASAELDRIVGDEDILFISLCHGGLLAGAGTFLARENNRPDGDSLFYPVRFSRYKHKDTSPQITLAELKGLAEDAHDRQVIIFDEDISSGRTTNRAISFFTGALGSDVVCLTTDE